MSNRDLLERLHDERDALEHLVSVLQREQILLVQAEVDALTALTGEKAAIVTRMIEVANYRQQGLAEAGFTPDEAGMRAWLNEKPEPILRNAWAQTLSMGREARELNRVNGLLISKHLSRTQQLIGMLKGESGIFYGADGQPEVITAARSVVVS